MLLDNTCDQESDATERAAGKPEARRRISAFRKDERGSMLVFGLVIFILMLWSLGLAIDAFRVENKRTLLQQTLDRAVLAAADLDQSEDSQQVVQDYFEKAGLTQYLGAVTVNSSSAAGELSFRRVSASAEANVDSMFLQMLGYDTLIASTASTAEEGITDLELSLILDVSGSMGWSSSSGNSKIYELREAAKDFSYFIQCNPNAARGSGTACSVLPGKVSMTMVPYSEQVTVGATLLDQMNVTAEHNSGWCVTFDTADFDTVAIDPNVPLQRTGRHDPWSSNTYASDGSRSCRNDAWRQIRPFVGDATEMETLIGSLSAGGNTSIDLAMKWGAAFLDPSLRDVITTMTTTDSGDGTPVVDPAFSGRPYDYSQDYSMKVIVLMTDGVNTNQHYLKPNYRSGPSEIWEYVDDRNRSTYSIYKASTNQYYYTGDGQWYDEPYGQGTTYEQVTCTRRWWRGKVCTTSTQTVTQGSVAVQMSYPRVWETFTTDWYAGWSWLSDPVSVYGNATKNSRLDAICDAVKNEGVVVYSVAFEIYGEGEDVMRNCASTPGHFFNADGTNLSEVFGVIASSINQLRLTQ